MIDLKLHQPKLLAPVHHHWTRHDDFSAYCACAFPSSVFVGGFCGYCNGQVNPSRAVANEKKEKGKEKTGHLEEKYTLPSQMRDANGTYPNDETRGSGSATSQIMARPLRGEPSLKEGGDNLFKNAEDMRTFEPYAHKKDESITDKKTAKSKPIPIPRQQCGHNISQGEYTTYAELYEWYSQATWAMFIRITKYRQQRDIHPRAFYNALGAPSTICGGVPFIPSLEDLKPRDDLDREAGELRHEAGFQFDEIFEIEL